MKFQQETEEIIQMEANNEETELNPKPANNVRYLQAIVDCLVIVIIYSLNFLIENFLEPSILYFTCDQDIFYPFKSSIFIYIYIKKFKKF